MGKWTLYRRVPAALLIAALTTPVSAWPQAAGLRAPGETGPITPAEEIWGGLATLIRDPSAPLTREAVETALGVRLQPNPAAGNEKVSFRLPQPAKWPIAAYLFPYGPQRAELHVYWETRDPRYSTDRRYCLPLSRLEDLLIGFGWKPIDDPPVLLDPGGRVWRAGYASVKLRGAPGCLGFVDLIKNRKSTRQDANALPPIGTSSPLRLEPSTAPLSPAEEVWGGLARLLRDPVTPLTRKTVEQAFGVKLVPNPEVGNGRNVFGLSKPAKWPLFFGLGPYEGVNPNDADATRFGFAWDGSDERFHLSDEYCVRRSDVEHFLTRGGWSSKTSPLNELAMDAPLIGVVLGTSGRAS